MPKNENNNFDDIKIINESLPRLDDQLETDLIAYVIKCWDKSVECRNDYKGYSIMSKIERIEMADKLENSKEVREREKWRSKIYLGWVKQAHISTTAYLVSNLLSGQWFGIAGQTSEDKQNAEYMTKLIKYLFDNNFNFKKVIIQALYQFVKKGNTVIKGFWQVIKSYLHDYEPIFESVQDPITGEVTDNITGFRQVKRPVNLYNDIQLEYIDIDDFQFFPVTGNISDATMVHRIKKNLSELKQAKGQYINLDKLESLRLGENQNNNDIEPIDLKECWIRNCFIGDKQISNAIVTVANDKYIIQYKPNPYDYGVSPFLWSYFENIEGTNLGKGLCFDSIPLQDAANLLINMIMDSQKMGTYSSTLIPNKEDENKFRIRPGAVIRWDDELFERGMFPQQFSVDISKLPMNLNSLQLLKQEFEASTIPEFIKGQRPQRDETATRDMLVQQGGENKIGLCAENFNEMILKVLVQLIYMLYRQRAKLDKDVRLKIAKICIPSTREIEEPVFDENGQPKVDDYSKPIVQKLEIEKTDEEMLEELPEIIPMDKINISVDGYKTNIKKQQTIQSLTQLLNIVPNASPELLRKVNEEGILDTFLLMLDIDRDSFVLSDEEANEKMKKEIQSAAELECFKMMVSQSLQGQMPPQQQQEMPQV